MDLEDEKESGIYGEAREELGENDEISPEEEAFMKGYEEEDDSDEEEDDSEYQDAFDDA